MHTMHTNHISNGSFDQQSFVKRYSQELMLLVDFVAQLVEFVELLVLLQDVLVLHALLLLLLVLHV